MAQLSQTHIGQSFEYAVVNSLILILGSQNVLIEEGPRLESAKSQFNLLPVNHKERSISAACTAIKKLVSFEPQLEACANGQQKLIVRLSNSTSKTGVKNELPDPRDIILSSDKTNWEIGIVAKHNHEALKHSRLSSKIDFGKEWFGLPCSQEYFAEIEPLFLRLNELKTRAALWTELPDKIQTIYIPLLTAFIFEFRRLNENFPGIVAPGLVRYLLGNFDYYRFVQLDSQIRIEVFNPYNTLSNSVFAQPSSESKALSLPSQILYLDFMKNKSGLTSETTINLVCDCDWNFSFRLHSASKKVEPSLKFDIKLLQAPFGLQTYTLEV